MPFRWRGRVALSVLLVAALAPSASANDSTAWIQSASGDLRATLQSTSVASSMTVNVSGLPHEMQHTASPGGGWGVCHGAFTPNQCLCPYGYSTCPIGAQHSYTGHAQGNTYTTTATGASLHVGHAWMPMSSTAPYKDMILTVVTVENLANQTLQDVHYRHGQAFRYDAYTGNPSGWATMSIGTNDAAAALVRLVRSSDLGMANPTPGVGLDDDPYNNSGTCTGHTVGPGSASGGAWFQHLPEQARTPCQPGGMAEIRLGDIPPGGSRQFEMVHGFAADEASALQALGPGHLGADFWFLAQQPIPSNLTAGSVPFTFYWAFRGLSPPNGTCPSTCGPPPAPCQPSPCGQSSPPPPPCPSCGGGQAAAYPGSPAPPSGQGEASNQAPHASFAYAPADPAPGEAVRFWDTSTDPDGAVAGWSWAFPGATATGQTTTQAFPAAGTYTVRLNVTDDAGATSTAVRTIEVGRAAAPAARPVEAPPAPETPVRVVAAAPCEAAECLGGAPTRPATLRAGMQGAEGPTPSARAVAASGSPLALLALAVAAAGVGAALATHRRWAAFGVLLFSRLRRSDLLDHPVRSQLAELVEAEPGVHLAELARRTGRSRSNTGHHLRVLCSAGLVKAMASGGLTRYFPGGQPAPAGLPHGPAAQRVLDATRGAAGLTVHDIADRAGMGYGAAHYHLRRLERDGLVELRGEDGLRVYPRAPDPSGGAGTPMA